MKFLLLVLLSATNLYSKQSYIDYVSPFHPVVGNSGMVASQNVLSSELGIEILNKGGNAVDAAVAVGFSLAITLPRAGNLGGGGFMLVYIKEKNEIFYIDYRSRSPLNSNIRNIFNLRKNAPDSAPINFNNKKFDIVRYGYHAPAIPGTVAGLLDAHSNFGLLPLEEIFEPVINMAKEGILVSYDLSKAIESTPQLKNDPESKKIYFIDNKPLPENYLMKRPDLANTISLISKNGKNGFYKGEVAKKFIDAMKSNKGLFEFKDLGFL